MRLGLQRASQGFGCEVLVEPEDPALIGQPAVWHARVKKSYEAERLVTFAQNLASEVCFVSSCLTNRELS